MAPKVVLAINAGSSSVKISVYTLERKQDPQQLADLQVSGLTAPPAKLSYTRSGETVHKDEEVESNVKSQDDGFKLLLDTLIHDEHLKAITSKKDISIACHRVVHGGDYDEAKIITKDTYHHIEQLSDLAPLHNGAALAIISSCLKELPDATNLACFDSQFHATIPPEVYTYMIDPEIARKNGLRKYGFHGISYAFIARSTAEFLGKPTDQLNIIALHLGSGASACAIKGGKSQDTTMGLTPLAGLSGATRSGSVDPSLVFHYASDVGKLSPSSTSQLHISRAEEILNKEAGWKALTGTTNFGDIVTSSDPKCELAFDVFVNQICAYVGSYYVSLGGQVDALVFAGGIGEKSAELRKAVTNKVSCLGFSVDDAKNEKGVKSTVGDIGKDAGNGQRGHRILVVQTDEQFEMARTCGEINDLWT